jgi:hypothetical protein
MRLIYQRLFSLSTLLLSILCFLPSVDGASVKLDAERVECERISKECLSHPDYAKVPDWPKTFGALLQYIKNENLRQRPGLAAKEEIIAQAIGNIGTGRRQVLKGISVYEKQKADEKEYRWKFTIRMDGAVRLIPEYWRDMVPMEVNDAVLPNNAGTLTTGKLSRVHFLDGNMLRLKGRVTIGDYVFEGNDDDPLAFLLSKEAGGAVYLCGSGKVTGPDPKTMHVFK